MHIWGWFLFHFSQIWNWHSTQDICTMHYWVCNIFQFFVAIGFFTFLPVYAKNALQREWGNFPFANWNGICWGLPLQLVQLIKIHLLHHLESFMWERKFEKKIFKKSHVQTPNGVLLIFKHPFPNYVLSILMYISFYASFHLSSIFS